MKLYLAGPMSGIKDFNFPAFMNAANYLRTLGHEVFNPAEKDIDIGTDKLPSFSTGDIPSIEKEGFSLREALAADTHFICLEADGIAMLPGWERSGGARAEWALAQALRLKTIYLT